MPVCKIIILSINAVRTFRSKRNGTLRGIKTVVRRKTESSLTSVKSI